MEAPSTASTPVPPIEERRSPSFFQKNKFTVISVIILIIALVPLVVLTQMHKKQAAPQTVAASATPTPGLTQGNAQPTLDATDQSVQDAINQSDSELNAVSQINSSNDSTAGL